MGRGSRDDARMAIGRRQNQDGRKADGPGGRVPPDAAGSGRPIIGPPLGRGPSAGRRRRRWATAPSTDDLGACDRLAGPAGRRTGAAFDANFPAERSEYTATTRPNPARQQTAASRNSLGQGRSGERQRRARGGVSRRNHALLQAGPQPREHDEQPRHLRLALVTVRMPIPLTRLALRRSRRLLCRRRRSHYVSVKRTAARKARQSILVPKQNPNRLSTICNPKAKRGWHADATDGTD